MDPVEAPCGPCARRSELLLRLGGALDWCARDPQRLWDTLALSDERLIAALGGSRREQLRAWHENRAGHAPAVPAREVPAVTAWRSPTTHARHAPAAHARHAPATHARDTPAAHARHAPATHARHAPATHARDTPAAWAGTGVRLACRHSDAYPRRLRQTPLAPRALWVKDEADRLRELLGEPLVAIVGTGRCTDYGRELARGLGQELSGAGIGVAAPLATGIGHAALAGASQNGGSTIAMLSSGVDECVPRLCAGVYRQLERTGCLLSELPCGSPSRRWAELARARTLALLADLVIVVEAHELPRELACAELARTLGTKLAAVPGRATSPASQGTLRLIKQGAELVRGAHDALALLYDSPPEGVPPDNAPAPLHGSPQGDAPPDNMPPACPGPAERPLDPRLKATLARVAAGEDTIAKLSRRGPAAPALVDPVLLDLAELELRGLLVRGDGGRYVPRAVAPPG